MHRPKLEAIVRQLAEDLVCGGLFRLFSAVADAAQRQVDRSLLPSVNTLEMGAIELGATGLPWSHDRESGQHPCDWSGAIDQPEDIHRAFAMAAHTLAFPQRSAIWGLTFMLALASPGFAQQDLRSTFPGRRIGGATRGACSSRLIVHLSPASSVMAPGNAGLGLLLGPSATPVPVAVTLRPLGRGGQPDHQSQPLLQRTLPAAPAGITLLALPPLQGPTVWESAPVCEASSGQAASNDPLSFVESVSPPALSLLIQGGTAEDSRLQAALRRLRLSCGGTVPTAEVSRGFGLEDVIQADWPASLPVRCP